MSEIVSPEVESLLDNARRELDYGINDFTIELLVSKLTDGDVGESEIFIPDYQRGLVWSNAQKSYFIESLLLRVPVPPIFLYDKAGRLEVVDGSQRLRTMRDFVNNKFSLVDLEKSDFLNGIRFRNLPDAYKLRFKNTPIRTFVLFEKTDPNSRFDIFRRLNTGGKRLTDAQIRKGAFPGAGLNLVIGCADDIEFALLSPVGKKAEASSERQELMLRFFAYSDCYNAFRHDVARFLNEYLIRLNGQAPEELERLRGEFARMVGFVSDHFPSGFGKIKAAKATPRVRFEAISVGINLALRMNPSLKPASLDWLESDNFKKLTQTHASNSGPRLRARVEFVRDALLGA